MNYSRGPTAIGPRFIEVLWDPFRAIFDRAEFFTLGELIGTSHQLLFTHISVVVVVSQQPLFGYGFESSLVVIFFIFLKIV